MPKYHASVRRELWQELSDSGTVEVEADSEDEARRMVEQIARSYKHPDYMSDGEELPEEPTVRSASIRSIGIIDEDA
jgi:hypothetical protein